MFETPTPLQTMESQKKVGPYSILICEDTPSWSNMAVRIIRRLGHQPFQATTPAQVDDYLAQIRDGRTHIDIVLLDDNLTAMGGEGAGYAKKFNALHIPIISFSNNTEVDWVPNFNLKGKMNLVDNLEKAIMEVSGLSKSSE